MYLGINPQTIQTVRQASWVLKWWVIGRPVSKTIPLNASLRIESGNGLLLGYFSGVPNSKTNKAPAGFIGHLLSGPDYTWYISYRSGAGGHHSYLLLSSRIQ
jgi:hypothetical protein